MLDYPVAYLEDTDINGEGKVVNPEIPKDIPMVVMCQANWCPHCNMAKPAFQKFANMNYGKVFCAAIQADGERESEKALGKRLNQIIPGFRGFPEYALFKNGKYVPVKIKGRGVSELEEFSKM